MVKVRAIIDFKDNEAKQRRSVGEEFEVTQERANYLNGGNPKGTVAVVIVDKEPVENFKMEDEEESTPIIEFKTEEEMEQEKQEIEEAAKKVAEGTKKAVIKKLSKKSSKKK